MAAIELDKLTWPEVRAAIDGGRDTVVVAFGATEQHGPHMPLATDALIGDRMARDVADRLGAFVAPTVRVGVSPHHVGFAGTMSLAEETFHAVVADVVRSLAAGGFRRIVLVPTHGGNFAPLGAAVEKLGELDGVRVDGLSDLSALLQVAVLGRDEYGVPLNEGGIHAGEWETSIMLALHPELVRMDRAEAGFTGEVEEAVGTMLGGGKTSDLAENGVIGDPAKASAEHGRRYWNRAVELALEQLGE